MLQQQKPCKLQHAASQTNRSGGKCFCESKLSLCTYWELSFKRSSVMTLQRCMCVWNAAGVWSVSESSWKKGMREEQIFVFQCLFLNDFHRRAFILLWCQKSVWKRGIPASRSRRESGPCAACTSPIALLRSQALFDDFTGLSFLSVPVPQVWLLLIQGFTLNSKHLLFQIWLNSIKRHTL